MNRYYRITNPEKMVAPIEMTSSEVAPIEKADSLAAVGEKPPEARVNMAEIIKAAAVADALRALAIESLALALGAVTVWSLNDESGKAKGWVVKAPTA
jgi:hypothetical protein